MNDTRLPGTPVLAVLAAIVLVLALVPSTPADGQDGDDVALERLDGTTRFETAAAIATARFDRTDDVVLTTGEGFADALAGAALEGALDAPVLLVPSDLVGGSVPDAVTDAISQLQATNATLLGGPNAISEDVEAHIVQHSTVADADRVAGSTRFETAEEIADRVGAGQLPANAADALGLDGETAAFVATGSDWPDSMAASPAAFAGGHPILLTGPAELHEAAERGLAAAGADVVFVLGGTGAVGSGVTADLRSQGYEVVRLSGTDRWTTATEIAETFADAFGYGTDDVGVATGFEFADALASAPYLGGRRGPLVLTPGNTTHPTTEAFFENREGEIEMLTVFGGSGAVAPSVAATYRDLAREPVDPAAPGVIEGTVTDADAGDAIENATVTAEGDNSFAVSTDADGNYRLEVTPETYDITAEADGYESATQEGVEVGEGETVEDVNLALDPVELDPGAIEGTVTDDETGEAIEGAEVTADNGTSVETTTNEDGDYSLEVEPDTYDVSVSADGYESATEEGIEVGEGETVEAVDFDLARTTVTDAPELVAVDTSGEPVVPSDPAVVSFTFDEELDAVNDDLAFHLHSFDGANDTHTLDPDFPDRVRLDEDDPDTVHVVFDQEAWSRAVAAGVDADAVRADDDRGNPEGGLGLKDVTRETGETTAPDLGDVDDVAVDADNDEVTATFVFDQPAQTRTAYGVVLADNTAIACGRDDDGGEASQHDVTCDADEGDAVASDAEVRRGWVSGVENGGGDPGALRVVDVADDGETAAPDLAEVRLDREADEVTYIFDSSVTDPDPDGDLPVEERSAFRVYYRNGVEVTSTDAEFGDGRRVSVAFEDGAINDYVAGITVEEGAVIAAADEEPNRSDELSWQRTAEADDTLAPQLDGVRVDEGGTLLVENREVTFGFDAELDALGDDARFALYGDSGDEAVAFDEGDCDLSEDEVVCETTDSGAFAEIDDAVLGGVGSSSVAVEFVQPEGTDNRADNAPVS